MPHHSSEGWGPTPGHSPIYQVYQGWDGGVAECTAPAIVSLSSAQFAALSTLQSTCDTIQLCKFPKLAGVRGLAQSEERKCHFQCVFWDLT